MSSSQVQHERRASQRFPFQLPVSLKLSTGIERLGVTQDVSARGALIYTDLSVPQGSDLEFTLMLPSEITLTESMRVRCLGKAVRVDGPGLGEKFGIAAVVERYEFLPDQAEQGSRVESKSVHDVDDSELEDDYRSWTYPSRA